MRIQKIVVHTKAWGLMFGSFHVGICTDLFKMGHARYAGLYIHDTYYFALLGITVGYTKTDASLFLKSELHNFLRNV